MKMVSFLGLIFVSLAFSCALLIMDEQCLPDEFKFWLYFDISLPLIVVVWFCS